MTEIIVVLAHPIFALTVYPLFSVMVATEIIAKRQDARAHLFRRMCSP